MVKAPPLEKLATDAVPVWLTVVLVWRGDAVQGRASRKREGPRAAEKPTVYRRAIKGHCDAGRCLQCAAGEIEGSSGSGTGGVPQGAGWVDRGKRVAELGVGARHRIGRH